MEKQPMSKRNPKEEDTQPQTAAPPAPGPRMVRLINTATKPEPRDITLRDGTNIRLEAYHPQLKTHVSEPIPKRLIPLRTKDGKASAVGKMIRRGEIIMEEVS
jgi:hypothetical protein